MNSKNTIRLIVLAGLLAWPGVETYRLWSAKQELAKSAQRQRVVSERLAYMQKIQVPDVGSETPATVPVSSRAAQ